MIYKTFGEIVQKIQTEGDLLTEDFIQTTEFQGYINDAINVCEAEIHKLGIEDQYFRKSATIDLVTNQEIYSLPADIYHNKILRVIYNYRNTIYTVHRMRKQNMYEEIALVNQYNTVTDWYQYLINNPSAASNIQLQLVPTSRETSPAALTIWYIRNAARYTGVASDICDMPEIALNYIYASVHWMCAVKEKSPDQAERQATMMMMRQLMVETLTNMVPDQDSTQEMDLSIYMDFS